MRPFVRTAIFSGLAMTVGVALLLLSVALTGQEIALETAARCVRSGGVLLGVGVLALVAGLVIAARALARSQGLARKGAHEPPA